MTGSESSVVVSLKELMRLENDRVEVEAAAERRRDEERAAQARVREAERVREAQRRAAEIERERRELERDREAQIHAQSIRETDLERARRESELRAQADTRAAIPEKELHKRLKKSAITLWAGLGGCVIVLVATIAFTESRTDRRLGELRRSHDLAEQQFMETRRAYEERTRAVEAELVTARAELERTKIDLATARDTPHQPALAEKAPHQLPTARQRKPRCAPCPPGDPLCGCLEP